MKTIYYLAPKDRLARFDDLWDKEDILATPYDIAKIPSLTTFVTKDRAISQVAAIVMDVDNLTQWSRAHVLSAVQQLQRFSEAQIIVIGRPGEEMSRLFKALNGKHIDDVIMAEPGDNIEKDLANCFAPPAPVESNTLAAAQDIMMRSAGTEHGSVPAAIDSAIAKIRQNVPENLKLTVAAAGTMPRCGTTVQAFMLAHFLKLAGFHPIICDRQGRIIGDIKRFVQGAKERDGILYINDMELTQEAPDAGYNAIIEDFGVLTSDNAESFCSANISVLVGGTKAWELAAYADAYKLLFPYSPQCLIKLATGASEQELSVLSKYLGNQIGIPPYAPDLWQLPRDLSTYTTLLLPQIAKFCRQQEPEYEAEAER